ncbi:hypothetical protein GGTG_11052 [Gaeumannomyces tritici R3-111a-1]|uniref:Uncharacterized protein n=1 Tax=Gaeumannomyces tritici (strain R3-111a-1) TaxID=644352 RepID=J3PC29_GAET3|nr:hypothetical protein GGTG_11052 [Gaeumannomyces tritici R3-111a-1]EJT71799.1 hypothetical protein GGTG_11052 [Gaeumannomyces tritici R3-111a-1]
MCSQQAALEAGDHRTGPMLLEAIVASIGYRDWSSHYASLALDNRLGWIIGLALANPPARSVQFSVGRTGRQAPAHHGWAACVCASPQTAGRRGSITYPTQRLQQHGRSQGEARKSARTPLKHADEGGKSPGPTAQLRAAPCTPIN